jgi:predicted metal-dependent hydrolase
MDGLLALRNGRFEVSESLLRAGAPAARKAFRDFYLHRGQRHLEQRVAQFAPKVGVDPGPISVRELGFHWASCGRGGALNFHWKVMMAPATVVDYVVVHELCHLHFRDHSDAFWNEVDKILPAYGQRKEWLRRNGASMEL